MQSKIFCVIFTILLCSCAPQQSPATPTLTPTAMPVPSAMPTLIPTVTSTPTEVPIPDHEFQVTDADGNTLIVVSDQLFKWENGKQIPMAIEDVTFVNAIDASNAARGIAPDEYFDVAGGQQALRDILLPEGIYISEKYKYYVDDFVLTRLYGVPVSLAKVDLGDGDIALVINFAVYGADKPIPVIVGQVQGDKLVRFDGTWVGRAKWGDDPSKAKSGPNALKAIKGGNFAELKAALISKPVFVGVVDNLDERFPDGNPNLGTANNNLLEFYQKIIGKYIAARSIVTPSGQFDATGVSEYGEYLNGIMEQLSGYDFDGFVPVTAIERLEE